MNPKLKPKGNAGGSAPALRVRKTTRRQRINRRSVLRMMEMMEKTPDSPHDPIQDFLTTGRTGRRNAMPDILGEHATTSTGDLPDCLEKLNTVDGTGSEPEASTSGGGGSGGATTPQSPVESPTTPQKDPPKEPDSANS